MILRPLVVRLLAYAAGLVQGRLRDPFDRHGGGDAQPAGVQRRWNATPQPLALGADAPLRRRRRRCRRTPKRFGPRARQVTIFSSALPKLRPGWFGGDQKTEPRGTFAGAANRLQKSARLPCVIQDFELLTTEAVPARYRQARACRAAASEPACGVRIQGRVAPIWSPESMLAQPALLLLVGAKAQQSGLRWQAVHADHRHRDLGVAPEAPRVPFRAPSRATPRERPGWPPPPFLGLGQAGAVLRLRSWPEHPSG